MATGPKIQYEISATTSGADQVEKLATELEKLDGAIDPQLAPRARAAADALRSIGQQQDAIDAFVRTKAASAEAARELAEAQARAQALGAAIASAGGPTRAQAGEMERLRDAVLAAKQEVISQAGALERSRQALAEMGIPTDKLAANQRDLAEQAARSRQALDALSRAAGGGGNLGALVAEAEAARKKLNETAAAAAQLDAELRNNRSATAAQKAELERLRTAADEARTAFEAKRGAVGAATSGMAEFARSSAAAGAASRAASDTTVSGLERIAGQLRFISSAAAAVVGGDLLGGMVGQVAQTADAYANLAARVKLATGEGEAFTAGFEGVFDVAQRTSSSLESTGTLFTKIVSAGKEFGVSQRDALALTETINQAVQLSGSSAQASDAAIQQLIQGLQSGVLRGEEFNSVMEQAPRLAQALANGLGVTTGALRQQAEAGALSTEVVIRALQGQAATVANEFNQLPPTVGRALTNLGTAWTDYVGRVDQANGISATAASAINALAGNLDTLGTLLFSAGKAAAAYSAVRLAQTFIANAAAAGQSAAATATETAAKAANTAAMAGNTAATAANTAAKAANAAAAGGVGSAAEGALGGVGRLAQAMSALKLISFVGIVTNLQEIGTWIGESIAKWQGYGKAQEEAERTTRALEQAQREIAAQNAAIAQQAQKAADAALGLNTQAKALVGQFEAVKKEGGTTAEALAKLAKEAQLTDITGITNMSAALDALAQRGRITAEQVRGALSQALAGEDLARFEVQARAAFDGSEQGARRLSAALGAIDVEALRRAGTSADELRSGFNAAAVAAINDVDALAGAVERLGVRNAETGRAMAGSLDKALEAATTERAVQTVIDRMQTLGQQGLISGEQLSEGLDKARAKLDEIQPGVNSLNEALGTFGLKSREELQQTADKMSESWQQISNSTQVSVQDKIRAFEQYKEAATAANGGIVPSQLRVQEEMLRIQAGAQNTGASFDGLGSAAVGAGIRMAESFQTAEQIALRVAQRTGQITQQLAGMTGIKAPNADIKAQTGNTREERLAGQNAVDATGAAAVRAKLAAGTLTEADRATVEAVLAAAKQNAAQNASATRLSAGAISWDAQRSVAQEMDEARRALDSLNQRRASAEAAEKRKQQQAEQQAAQKAADAKAAPATAVTVAPATAAASAAQQPSARTVTVKLDLGGGRSISRDVAAGTENDVIAMLEDAGRAMGVR